MTIWSDVSYYDLGKDILLPLAIGAGGFIGVIRSIRANGELAKITSESNAKLARENLDHNAKLARDQAERESQRDREQHSREIEHAKKTLKSALMAELLNHKQNAIFNLKLLKEDSRILLSSNPRTEIYSSYINQIGLLSPAEIWGVVNAYGSIKDIRGLKAFGKMQGCEIYEDDAEDFYLTLSDTAKESVRRRLESQLKSIQAAIESVT